MISINFRYSREKQRGAGGRDRQRGDDLLTPSLQSGDGAMPPEHMQKSLGCLCLRVQHGIPSRPERKKRPLYVLPTHPLAVANRPLPCNVGGVGISCLNKKGTIFRTGKPVPSSALLGTNIAWIGGAGVRHGEDGGDVFSLGTDSGAMVLH